jgi:hypothetical protein
MFDLFVSPNFFSGLELYTSESESSSRKAWRESSLVSFVCNERSEEQRKVEKLERSEGGGERLRGERREVPVQ